MSTPWTNSSAVELEAKYGSRPVTTEEIEEVFGVRLPGGRADRIVAAQRRADHLAWSKERALEYLDRDDVINAWGSLVSDLGKEELTATHPGLELGMMLMMSGHNTTVPDMRHFIEGFN